jgi:hypothetical protein
MGSRAAPTQDTGRGDAVAIQVRQSAPDHPAAGDETGYAGRVAAADAAYLGALSRAADALGADAGGAPDLAARFAAFRTSSAAADRAHGLALTAAVAALAPALDAAARDLEALAARDRADGTWFTPASSQRRAELVAARARLFVDAMRPAIHARTWHRALMADLARALGSTPVATGSASRGGPTAARPGDGPA